MTRMFTRALALFLSLATMTFVSLGVATAAEAKPRPAGSITVPVTGTSADGGAVAGTFNVQQFVVKQGVMQAVGTFTGSVANASGATAAAGTQQISVPVDVAAAQGSCEILDLVLGPLDLNLLGLQVHLDRVHLNITAQSGPGNLLGNLLCAVAGLLDGNITNGILHQIANLLNQILGLLG